ncbi:MAG: TonB-dependent receptor [Bacteroidota bacterium]
MQKWIRCLAALLLLLPLFVNGSVFAQTTATLEGVVKDSQTGDALPGANILIVGTGFGAATDVSGKFTVRTIPAGTYDVRVTYVGYNTVTQKIDFKEGQTLKRDFKLDAIGVQGEMVVVTAQASGQNAAINQQLASMPVMNVVSAARIQELPDANAAESVARLPGISVIRTGGEGSQVVIRGLAPQYNQVTIDGVELPSDVPSGNNLGLTNSDQSALGDRGADLSMISSSMLNGIEVIKSITPDMDAALLGGVVNFDLRKAAKSAPGEEGKASWLPGFELWSQGGYDDLKNTASNYKFVGSLEKRFFDESFGVFVQASAEKRNLSDNELGATYALIDKGHGDAGIPDLTALNLNDVWRNRERLGGTMVLDYQHETGEIGLMNFLSSSNTRSLTRGEGINATGNSMTFNNTDAETKVNVISNLLSVKEDLSLFRVAFKFSHSYSESQDPQDLFFNFAQTDAGLANKGNLGKVYPTVLASYVIPNSANAFLDQIQTYDFLSKERTLTGSLDLSTDMGISQVLSTTFKVGGMFQHRTREYNYTAYSGSQLYGGGSAVVSAIRQKYPWLLPAAGNIGLANFTGDSYSYGKFLNGDYSLAYPINFNLMWDMLPIARRTNSLEGYQINKLASAVNDYSGYENKSALYAMFTLKIGDQISILPGARYQNLTTNWTALRAVSTPGGFAGKDTTVEQSHGYVLPMVHVRYQPLDWMQIHFAYTNTLNYPDYSAITPRYYVTTSSVSYNNYKLKPARSENFDLVVSLHSNDLGLFSIDGFKKRIKDLVFYSHTFVTDFSAYPDLPQFKRSLYTLDTYVNNPIAIDVWGIETEWQTHFWYLPQPFSGIVLNINYTHIFSEAKYPRTVVTTEYNPDGTFSQVFDYTPYSSRMLQQPNDILNLAFGYDYGGFSARLSMLYLDNVFKHPDFWMQNRINSDKSTRWDLSVRQELPWYGMTVFFSINNMTGQNDVDINEKTGFPASEQRYGMTADAGVRIRL